MTTAALDSERTAIYQIRPEHVIRTWPRVEGILSRVVKPESGYTLESVLTALQLCRQELWVIGEYQGVAVTAVQNRPAQRVLWIQFIAGDHMKDWLDDWIETLEDYAHDNQCDAIEFNGRRGWNKIGERHPEYKPVWTTFRRELTDGR